MSYEPRGKVARLIEHLRARPEQTSWGADEVAQIMEIPRGNIAAYTGAVTKHRQLFSKLESGRSVFSLQDFEPAAPPQCVAPPGWQPPKMTAPRGGEERPSQASEHARPKPSPTPAPTAAPRVAAPEPEPEGEEAVAFNAALWADGDLIIYGAQLNEDNSFTLTAEQTATLCRLLHGQGPAE